jgi:molybdenum cofactor guanylyltransferase
MNFTAIILAGGQSRRMGSNKALLSYHGKPLIQYSIDLALQFTNHILISANNCNLDHLGYPVIRDVYPVKAPLAGIHAGLRASATDWNLVLTCDMPNVSKGLTDLLLASLNDSLRMVVPQHDGFLEPLCGFYHRDLIPLIEKNIVAGKLSLLDLPGSVPHRFLTLAGVPPAEIANLFTNLNEKKDLLVSNTPGSATS